MCRAEEGWEPVRARERERERGAGDSEKGGGVLYGGVEGRRFGGGFRSWACRGGDRGGRNAARAGGEGASKIRDKRGPRSRLQIGPAQGGRGSSRKRGRTLKTVTQSSPRGRPLPRAGIAGAGHGRSAAKRVPSPAGQRGGKTKSKARGEAKRYGHDGGCDNAF